MNHKKIAVLGGGNGAHAMAADLTQKGYDVILCELPEFEGNFKRTLDKKSIELIDAWGKIHYIKLSGATLNIKEAVSGAKYIMISAPAIGAVKFFELALPYLVDGQTVIKWSGNFSALLFAKMMRDLGIKTKIKLGESHTLPWGCRLVAPGTVQVMVWVVRLVLSVFPAKDTNEILEDINKLYPVVAGENVLSSSFNNLNPVVHPIGTIMNTGWIENIGKDFHFYRDGNTISVSRGIKAIFEEVRAVAKALDIAMIEYPEEDFWKKSAIMSTYSRAAFDKEGAIAKISGPSSLKSRYITEDLPQGLVPIVHLARKFAILTPVIDSVITLASVANETDYMKNGLSLKQLGLEGMDKSQITYYLFAGNA